ncbi:MAG: peptide ABC transporter substrate-binding protein [Oligoflexia bacterium]|nr:peptide ABC transporter substrate-binding protein [Oligoflexia bacterium]
MRKFVPALFVLTCLGGSLTAQARLEPSVLRASVENEPSTLDWNHHRTSTERFVISFLMRGLLQYDAKSSLICDLCKSYRLSEDGKTIVFELLPDVRWSDGVPLEARHFVDSLRRLLDPASASRNASEFADIAGARQEGARWDPERLGVSSESPQLLKIQLTAPSPLFLHRLTTVSAFPIRKDQLTKSSKTGFVHAQNAVLGPYFLAEWRPGKRLVLEGNPEYRGQRPVYRVDLVIGQHAALFEHFRKGRIDIMPNPTTEDLMKFPGQKVQVNPFLATRYLLMNVKHAPLTDPKLRRAMVYSLDRESLPAILRNGDRKVTGLIPPGLPGHRELPLATQDFAQAMAERGPTATPVQVRLLYRNSENQGKIAQWLIDRMKKIQVRLIPQPESSENYRRRFETRDYDLVLATWLYKIASPLEFFLPFRTGAPANRSGWSNVAFDAQLDELLHARDPGKIAQLVDQMTQILEIRDVGVIPLDYPSRPYLLGPRVQSFAITAFGDPDLVKIQLKQ